jgi:hypothetical protein
MRSADFSLALSDRSVWALLPCGVPEAVVDAVVVAFSAAEVDEPFARSAFTSICRLPAPPAPG